MKSSVAAEAEARQGRKKQSFPLPSQSLEKMMIAVLGSSSSSAFASEPRRVMGVGGRERGRRHGGRRRALRYFHACKNLPPSPLLSFPLLCISQTHLFPPPSSQLEFRRLDRKFPGHQGKEELKFVETHLTIAPNFRLPSREESDK